jgi:hypothetical protein
MTTHRHVRRACARALLCAALAALASAAATRLRSEDATHAAATHATATTLAKLDARQDSDRVDIRLRSLTTRATGKLTVEPSEGGGRARLTALNLPDPRTVTPGARTYVVWAVSGGRILNLGELKVDARGNGGLAFDRPEGFDRYGVIITAEASAGVERPGDPVLTTRADEAAALYTTPAPPADTPDSDKTMTDRTNAETNTTDRTNAPDTTATPGKGSARPAPKATRGAASNATRSAAATVPVAAPSVAPSRRGSARGAFYSEVEDAIASTGGGRVVEFAGDGGAPGASGAARAAYREGRAYVRANFRGVPLPSALGASVYVLWGVLSDGRIVYMGSLPATDDLNRAEVYVRVAGFDANDYTLFVTAEAARPAHAPSTRRVLRPTNASYIVK